MNEDWTQVQRNVSIIIENSGLKVPQKKKNQLNYKKKWLWLWVFITYVFSPKVSIGKPNSISEAKSMLGTPCRLTIFTVSIIRDTTLMVKYSIHYGCLKYLICR